MFSIRPVTRNSPKLTANLRLAPARRRTCATTTDNMATITEALTNDHRELEQYHN